DPVEDRVALFGGSNNGNGWNDTWILDQLGPLSVPASKGNTFLLLAEPRPNPSSSSVSVQCAVAAGQLARVSVLDVTGRTVRTLAVAVAPGDHDLNWDGRNETGSLAPAGLYFIELRAAASFSWRKAVLVR